MASYVRNVYTKNYKNLVILLQVPISIVTDGFWRFFLFILADFMRFNFPR